MADTEESAKERTAHAELGAESGAAGGTATAKEPLTGTSSTTRSLLIAGGMVILGLMVAGIAPIRGTDVSEDHHHFESITGGLIVVAGWLLLAIRIHRFGRNGADHAAVHDVNDAKT